MSNLAMYLQRIVYRRIDRSCPILAFQPLDLEGNILFAYKDKGIEDRKRAKLLLSITKLLSVSARESTMSHLSASGTKLTRTLQETKLSVVVAILLLCL